MESYTDDDLLRFYEAALGPLHNPTDDWLADALVWIRRIVVADSVEKAISMAVAWTGESPQDVRELALKLREAAGKAPPPPPAEPADSRIVNADTVKQEHLRHGRTFGSTFQRLSDAAGGEKLGCSLYEVAPGKRAFPFHAHYGMEEAIYVLEGEGTLRLGEGEFAVRAGTYAAFPPGPDAPHQLINTGTTPLRYLCLSSGSGPEVVVYPDSGKVLAAAGGWPPKVRVIARLGENLGYWDGEGE